MKRAAAGVLGTEGQRRLVISPSAARTRWHYADCSFITHSMADKAFDKGYSTEQIAGDELEEWQNILKFTPEIMERLIATGYLRNAADDTINETELNRLDVHHAILQRTGEMMAGSLFGLTISCAKSRSGDRCAGDSTGDGGSQRRWPDR